MKKLQNIRKRLLKQMAFSVFVMAVLPLSTRTATTNRAIRTPVLSNAGAAQSDVLPEPGKCAVLRSNGNQ